MARDFRYLALEMQRAAAKMRHSIRELGKTLEGIKHD